MSQMHQFDSRRLSVRPSVRFKLHLRDGRTDGRMDGQSARPWVNGWDRYVNNWCRFETLAIDDDG